MKIVHLDKNNIVQEIIPEDAIPIEKYYSKEYVSRCISAPDYVEQNWVYDHGQWHQYEYEPEIPIPSTEELTLMLLADHEERICLIELGV